MKAIGKKLSVWNVVEYQNAAVDCGRLVFEFP